ncbi:MAG: rubrerythrin family protein [Verrucomicrobia bacterium]|nr:rubrerythrin family protein [Verrucomicrobiota bacterium]
MEKTKQNLIAGIIGESTAGATYAAFAAQAAREGYPEIQKMFEATSKAESIHAANHARVLKKLGGELPKFKIEIEVGTTLENLAHAKAGEVYEFSEMYPAFLKDAEEEDAKAAIVTFAQALEVEKVHAKLYQAAIDAVNAGTVSSLPKKYLVCPVCGDTVAEADLPAKCPYCGVPGAKYLAL